MRSRRMILGLIVFCLGLWFKPVLAADKIAYVDLSRIFSEFNKTKDYDKALTDKESVYSADREKKVNEIKQFQDKMNLLSDKEKEAKQGDLESRIKTLQDYDRQKQTDLRKEQDEKMKEILKDIEDTVKQHSEKEGYTLVFNDRVLIYQNKSMDITDKIIEILNKGYKK
ncbi:MAG: OmpH family outer membrane protein [Candidatus Omnitrophota bacterium]